MWWLKQLSFLSDDSGDDATHSCFSILSRSVWGRIKFIVLSHIIVHWFALQNYLKAVATGSFPNSPPQQAFGSLSISSFTKFSAQYCSCQKMDLWKLLHGGSPDSNQVLLPFQLILLILLWAVMMVRLSFTFRTSQRPRHAMYSLYYWLEFINLWTCEFVNKSLVVCKSWIFPPLLKN